MLVKPRSGFYLNALPTPADVLLLIEVADSTVDLDLGDKLRLYARAGIGEYWVFDLARKTLLVHTDPVDLQYKSDRQQDKSTKVTPQAFDDLAIDLSELLGE